MLFLTTGLLVIIFFLYRTTVSRIASSSDCDDNNDCVGRAEPSRADDEGQHHRKLWCSNEHPGLEHKHARSIMHDGAETII